jgi:hypothetical protein
VAQWWKARAVGQRRFAGIPASQASSFFVGDVIDVSVEILSMNALQQQMSSGVSYYEAEHYDLIGERRGVLAVSAEIIGVVS